jgi:hypothetical protein
MTLDRTTPAAAEAAEREVVARLRPHLHRP